MSWTEVESGGCKWKFHDLLAQNLDNLKEHNKDDWDFKCLFSGDGATRTGKSTLATQCAQYVDPSFAANWRERMIFDGKSLVEAAYKIGKGKALVYDEAREGLDSKKQMHQYTQNLLDYLSQCGNLNQFLFIVLPDFFELPKSLALNQSIFLINCYARKGFQRGYFDFFNRIDKKYLYIKGQKWLDYRCQRPTWDGTFVNYMPFDRDEYEKLKSATLRKKKKKENYQALKEQSETHMVRIKILAKWLQQDYQVPVDTIAERIGVSRQNMYKTYFSKGKNR